MNINTKYIFTSLAAIMAMSNSADAEVKLVDLSTSGKSNIQLSSLTNQSNAPAFSKTCGCSYCAAQKVTDSIKA